MLHQAFVTSFHSFYVSPLYKSQTVIFPGMDVMIGLTIHSC